MGIITRQSFKSSIASYLGVLVGLFNFFWLATKFLEPSQIGIINFLEMGASFTATLAGLGASSIVDKFFPKFKDENNQHNGYLVFLLAYVSFGFTIFSLGFVLFYDFWLEIYTKDSTEVIPYFYLILPFNAVFIYLILMESYARIHLRIAIPNLLRDVLLRLLISLSIILYALHYFDFWTLVVLRVLSYFVIILIIILYLKNLKVLFFKIQFSFIDKSLFKEILVYGLFIVLGSAGTAVFAKIDILMLPALTDFTKTGIYTIAYYMGTIIEIPKRALSQISKPIISQAWANKDLPQINLIYKKSSLNQFIVGSFLFLLIWLNIDDIFAILPKGEIYIQGKYVVFFIALTRLIDMLTGVNDEIIMQSPAYKFNLIIVSFLALLLILTNLWLIPIYGIIGAALATCLSYFAYNLVKFIFIWIKFGLQPFDLKSIYILALGISVYILTPYIPNFSVLILNVLFKSTIITSIFWLIILGFNLSEDFSKFILDFWKFLKNKIS